MKRIITSLLVILSLVMAPAASAQGLSGLGALLRGGKGSAQSDTTSTQGGGLGSLLGGVASALGLGKTETTAESMAGVWSYNGPAVTFKSENLLLKAGGAAASASVERKIETYYKRAGLTNLKLTVNTDSTFTMKGKRSTVSGTIEPNTEAGTVIFHFKAFKAINIGSMEAYVKLQGKDKMELTFDVTKLMTILESVGSLSGSSTIKAASQLLSQYDGMTAGFDLKKTADAPETTTTGTTTTGSRKK